MKKDEADLRAKILELAKEYYKAAHMPKMWKKGGKIPYAARVYDEKEIVNLVDSSLDFWLTAGRYHEKFEKEMAKWWGHKHCSMANSGSSANLLALSAFLPEHAGEKRLGKGDEIITTASGFPTTVNPILQAGCVPVFLDTEVGTYNINCGMLEEAVSEKTKGIMIAHTLGNPFNIDKISEICKKNNLFLIEDCCDAIGAEWDGKKVGMFGELATASFYPAHHITTGEGGAVLTSNALLNKAVNSFRDWGRDCWCAPGKADSCKKRFKWKLGELPYGYDHKYIYSNIGYNLKATDMQAAIGLAQLGKLDIFIEKRRENFEWYMKNLNEYGEYFIFPRKEKKANPSPFGFALTVRKDAPFSRNDIVQYLEGKNIATRMVFGGNITKQPAYIGIEKRVVGELNGADMIMDNAFWIGVYPGLRGGMKEYVGECFGKFLKKRGK
ncbi:MAG: lipopolysaccharide biosynthesis protein RfbH [Candidatus Micrarchaeota archaeon]